MCSSPAGQLACSRWVCWPLTNNRSNRVGKIHTWRGFAVSHYAASFPDSIPPTSTETHVYWETIRQTDVVQQLVCMVSDGIKGDALSSRWRWVSEGLAWPVTLRWDGGGGALVEAGEQPFQLTSTGRSCPTGYWLAFLLVRISIRHQLHHLVSIGQKTNLLLLLFSLLSQWAAVVILDML